MKRGFALFTLVLVLLMTMVPVVAFAAETADVEFDLDNLVINGVALAPLISIIISIIKGWTKLDSKYIPLINVGLGTVAVLVVGIVNQGMSFVNALIMTLGIVFGSQVFHETFGHAAKILQELFGRGNPPQEE